MTYIYEDYKDYLHQPKHLTLDEMAKLHQDILDDLDIRDDEDSAELYDDFARAAISYAEVRMKWLRMSANEKAEIDPMRTSLHNSVITHLNMLARYAKMQGKAAAWRDTLGYEEDDKYNRKAIGDFACFVAFLAGVNSR